MHSNPRREEIEGVIEGPPPGDKDRTLQEWYEGRPYNSPYWRKNILEGH